MTSFAQFAQAVAARSASERQRLAWWELRRLFNALIYRPVWDGRPASISEWEDSTVERHQLAPLLSLLEADGTAIVQDLPDAINLPRVFYILERVHQHLLETPDRHSATLVERSLATDRSSPAELPASFARRAAVERLLEKLRNAPRPIAATLLHGSLADTLVVDGFSDADVLCFIDGPDSSRIAFWDAARWLMRLNHELLAVNPCMHHGPMIAFTADFDFTAEASLPSAMVRHGVWLKGGRSAARYHDGTIEAVLAIGGFEDFFARQVLFVTDLHDGFDVLWWTSTALLLPLLFHQLSTGASIYKRECLEQEPSTLPAAVWATIRRASALRLTLGHWIRERLPLNVHIDPAANPGEVVAEHRARLAMTPGEVRGLGLDDALLDEARAMWIWIRERTLAAADRYLGASEPVPPVRWEWVRPTTAFPRRLDLDAYAHARESFLARCRQHPEVRAVFEFGQVGCPGLSDIDFWVVLDDEAHGSPPDLTVETMTADVAQTMGHDPLFVAASMLPQVGAVFPIFANRQIFGAPMAFPVSERFSRWTQAAALTHKNLRKYPADVDWVISQPALDVRTALAVLHSAAHMQRTMEILDLESAAEICAAVQLDTELRARFAAGDELTPSDVFEAVRAALACCGPLRRALIDFWLQAAATLAENRNVSLPAPANGERWMQTQLSVGLDDDSPNDGPTLRPLLSEYLDAKEALVRLERARGRQPSPYIDDPGAVPTRHAPACEYFSGWQGEEHDEVGSRWRWAMGEALLIVASPSAAELTLTAHVMARELPQDVVWYANERPLSTWTITEPGWTGPYTLDVHTDGHPVRLRMIPSRPGRVILPDERKLAIALRDLSIR